MTSFIGFLLSFIVMVGFCPSAGAQTATKKAPATAEKRLADVEKDILRIDREVNVFNLYALPDYLTLCDKKAPLVNEDVRERFERELYLFLQDRGNLTVVVKRYFKYLPMINEEIGKMGLPQDLIFLAIAESYLNPRASSSAGAAGMWQFIKETGKKEGLNINDNVDERYNMKRATRSGLAHLKRLYGEFNDWFIAMAAYNAGAARLREVLENQNSKDFFDLYLPEETERYVFRIIALKEIILHRDRYGIMIDESEFYRPVVLAEVNLDTSEELHTNVLAKAMEVSYRTFRIYNLHIKRYRLPKGSYRINVPVEKKEAFFKALRNCSYITVSTN